MWVGLQPDNGSAKAEPGCGAAPTDLATAMFALKPNPQAQSTNLDLIARSGFTMRRAARAPPETTQQHPREIPTECNSFKPLAAALGASVLATALARPLRRAATPSR